MDLKKAIEKIESERKKLEESVSGPYHYLDEDIRNIADSIINTISQIDESFATTALSSSETIDINKAGALANAIRGDSVYKGADLEINSGQEAKGIKQMEDAIPFLKQSLFCYERLDGVPYDFDGLCRDKVIPELADAYETVGDRESQIKTLLKGARLLDPSSTETLIPILREEGEVPHDLLSELFDIQVKIADDFSKSSASIEPEEEQFLRSYFEGIMETFRAGYGTIVGTACEIVDCFISQGFLSDGWEKALIVEKKCLSNPLATAQTCEEFKKCKDKWNEVIKEREKELAPSEDKLLRVLKRKETIKAMSKDIKIFVGTSLLVFDTLSNSEDYALDYSPAVLPLFKALETILYKISVEQYLPYLRSTKPKGTNYSNLIFEDGEFVDPKDFSIRQGISILIYWKNWKFKHLYTGVLDFFKSKGIIEPKRRLEELFIKLFDKECIDCRNQLAHRFRIDKCRGLEAWKYITDTARIIDFCYEHFGPLLKED